MFHACYDLSLCPPTYDVITFLGFAELERIKRKERFINIHVLPGPKGGFRVDNLWPSTVEERVKILHSIVEPLCWLLPSVGDVKIEQNRPLDLRGTFGYQERYVSLKFFVELMRQNCRPFRPRYYKFEKNSKLITITLREAAHHPKRNSKVDEWIAAARKIKAMGYYVLVIRDTEKANEPIKGIDTHPDASVNLETRAALYSAAKLNLGINNGPMWMAFMLDAPVMMLRPTTNELKGCYDDAFFIRNGLLPGSQLPTSPNYQWMFWEYDTEEAILRRFGEVIECLNG